jgi:hypothetical protein
MVGTIQYFLANLDLTKCNRLTKRLDNSVDGVPKRWELYTDEIMKSSPMLKSSWENGVGGESILTVSSSCIPPRGKYLLYCTPSTCLLHQSLRLPTHPYDAYAVQKTCRWHQTHLSLPEASRTMTAVRQVMNMSWRDHRAKYGFIESLLSKSVSISSLSSGITNGHGPDHAGASKKSLHIIVSHVSQAK